jgi:hypothetical protein
VYKKKLVLECHKGPITWTDSLNKRPQLGKMDMRLDTWNVESLCRTGSIMNVAKEISKYNLYLVGVHKVRSDRGGTVPAGEYIFLWK